MVNDIWTSVKAYLYERTSSPLLGALIIGWIAWNFKILMLFFSKADYAVKIWEVDHFYEQTFFMFRSYGFEHWLFSNHVFCVFVMPAATAAFYIYVFPWFSYKVFNHSYQKQIDLNNQKKVMQGSEIIDAEEKAEILGMYEEAKLETRELTVKHRQEVERLEGQVATVIQEKEEYRQQLNELLEKPFLKEDDKVDSSSTSKESPVQSKGFSKPSYVSFYERLDLQQKNATEHVARILLQDNCDFDELAHRLVSEATENALVHSDDNLKSYIGQLKLYDIIDTYSEGYGESYILTDDGKSLYRYILDNGLESNSKLKINKDDVEILAVNKKARVEEIMRAIETDPTFVETANDYLKIILSRLANQATSSNLSGLMSGFTNQGKARMYLDKLVDEGLIENLIGEVYTIPKEIRTLVHEFD
ncbi:hypothetical protein Q8W41_19325 [Vibrio splendidus]|uniref:hypothetical protein n=1 Tax=Vibrio splendidus TaxID=29497 RepID=UPI002734EEA9|nr:hypothetical protein [Vibrio splendidus]MDP2591649.1 hypothetical protein [Vibrio splendidus]